MPRAAHPIDKVLEYFRTAPLDAAEQALHVVKGILKERQPAPAAPTKAKRTRGPNKPKAHVPTLTAAQAGAVE